MEGFVEKFVELLEGIESHIGTSNKREDLYGAFSVHEGLLKDLNDLCLDCTSYKQNEIKVGDFYQSFLKEPDKLERLRQIWYHILNKINDAPNELYIQAVILLNTPVLYRLFKDV